MTISPKITNPTKKALRKWRKWFNRSKAGHHRLTPPRGRERVAEPLHLDGHLLEVVCRPCNEVMGHTVAVGARLLIGFPYYEVDGTSEGRFAFTCGACGNSYGHSESRLADASVHALSDGKLNRIHKG